MRNAKFAKPSAYSAPYFRPAEFVDSFAVVLKPREILKSGGDGKGEALCSAIIFDTEESLEAGKPTRVIVDAIVNVGLVYRQLVRAFDTGSILAGYVGQGEPTSYGTKPWLIKDLDEDTAAKVAEVWNKVTA